MPSQSFSLSEDDVKTVNFVENNLTKNVVALVLNDEIIWAKYAKIRAPLWDTSWINPYYVTVLGTEGFAIASHYGDSQLNSTINGVNGATTVVVPSVINSGAGFAVGDACEIIFPSTYIYKGVSYTVAEITEFQANTAVIPHSGVTCVCTGVNSAGGATSFRYLKSSTSLYPNYITTKVSFRDSNNNPINGYGVNNDIWTGEPISIDLFVRSLGYTSSITSSSSLW